MVTRSEHLAWCKARAIELLEAGNLADALASMASDMQKHEGTAGYPGMLNIVGMMEVATGNSEGLRRWIEGFN